MGPRGLPAFQDCQVPKAAKAFLAFQANLGYMGLKDSQGLQE